MIAKNMETDIFFDNVFHPKCLKMVLPLMYIVLVTIYINIPGYYLIQGNKSLFSLNLQCSVYEYCYLNVSFFQGTVLDYLLDF